MQSNRTEFWVYSMEVSVSDANVYFWHVISTLHQCIKTTKNMGSSKCTCNADMKQRSIVQIQTVCQCKNWNTKTVRPIMIDAPRKSYALFSIKIFVINILRHKRRVRKYKKISGYLHHPYTTLVHFIGRFVIRFLTGLR